MHLSVVVVLAFLLPLPVQATMFSREQIDSIPAAVSIDGVEVTLQASIWKDLMPKVTSPGTVVRRPGYQMRITLKAGAGRMSPDSTKTRVVVRPDRIWVVRGKDIWEGNFAQASRDGVEDYVIRSGPPWPHGTAVDVIVRFLDDKGTAHLVKTLSVPVEAVY